MEEVKFYFTAGKGWNPKCLIKEETQTDVKKTRVTRQYDQTLKYFQKKEELMNSYYFPLSIMLSN